MLEARLANERGLAVHLGAARAALRGLAVPAHREVGGAVALDPVDGIQHHHAGLDRDPILDLLPAALVAAPHGKRDLARLRPGRFPRGGRLARLRRGRAGSLRGAGRGHPTFSFAGSNSSLSSAGISGSGVGSTRIASPTLETHMFTLPSNVSGFGKSSREWAPRLSLRRSALRVIASETVSMFKRSR